MAPNTLLTPFPHASSFHGCTTTQPCSTPSLASVSSANLVAIRCCATDVFTSPKTGAVGERRFRDGALPGTYWNESNIKQGEGVTVSFNTGIEKVSTVAMVGENLLRVAERCGVMAPDPDFCFQGTCCNCEMEVLGGAKEVGFQSASGGDELVRSCLCPVPGGRSSLQVNLISEVDIWNERVV